MVKWLRKAINEHPPPRPPPRIPYLTVSPPYPQPIPLYTTATLTPPHEKLRAGKEEVRRLRGQLEATGLSDTAMMGLLRGRDAALAAAAARGSALEASKVCYIGLSDEFSIVGIAHLRGRGELGGVGRGIGGREGGGTSRCGRLVPVLCPLSPVYHPLW